VESGAAGYEVGDALARFIGEYQHSIDQKSRLIIPARWRESIDPETDGSGLYLTPGFDKCLFVYTPAGWRVAEEKVKNVSYSMPEGRQFQRLFFARARFSEIDNQGRILIEADLRKAAELKKKVVLIGVAERMEIWDAEKWQGYEDRGEENFDSIAEGLM
jgi:MraZ protein